MQSDIKSSTIDLICNEMYPLGVYANSRSLILHAVSHFRIQ